MAFTFKFYSDSGLTAELTNLISRQLADGSSAANDYIVYLGSTQANRKARASSDPGVDQITVSIASNYSAWQASTAYVAGDIVESVGGDGYRYKCTVGGTSGGSEPTWPAEDGTVVDGTVTWENTGELHPATEVKLAATAGGLAGAVGGDPLDLGTQILSGVGNATEVHMRIDQDTHDVETYTDLQISVNELDEEAV